MRPTLTGLGSSSAPPSASLLTFCSQLQWISVHFNPSAWLLSHSGNSVVLSPVLEISPPRPSTPCALHPEVTHPLVSLENLLCPHASILPLCVPKSLSGSLGNRCITDTPDWSTDPTRAGDVSFLLLAVSWLSPHKPQTQHKMLVT